VAVQPMNVSKSSGSGTGAVALSVEGLESSYGASAPSLNGVSLEVKAGQAVALLGPNGAGKTTTIRSIAGLMRLHSGRILSGRVEVNGEDVTTLKPHQIVRKGLGQVPEGRMIFSELTVQENLLIGASTRRDQKAIEAEIEQIFEWFPQLLSRRNHEAGWLSGGEQQMLAIGRGLMASPRLLLLDEVSLGLAPIITRNIFQQLQAVRERTGAAMLMVEQNARLALEFCDYAYVIEGGRIVMEGPADELQQDTHMQELYLGGSGGEAERSFADAKRYRRRPRWLS
jgi:branched-chain amino acid transport system ATP-binding protein